MTITEKTKNKISQITIIISIILLIILCVKVYYLDNMPKRVCHIEYTTEKYVVPDGSIWTIGPRYYGDEQILCEDGVNIWDWGHAREIRYSRNNIGKVCLIKIPKEVCEIK